jgi:hypothetical protein
MTRQDSFMTDAIPFHYRTSQLYGWPFYAARKLLRGGARRMQRAADALSRRENYPSPFFSRPLLPANAKLKDAHRGRRCFIIGNGPSLKSQDLTPLAGEITIVMNGFLHHPVMERYQPTYYCLADPCYFDRSASSDEFLDRLVGQVTQSHFVVPYAGASQMIEERRVPPERISFVTFAGILASSGLPSLDFTRPIPSITTCAEMAMLLALHAGCSPIHLLGFDHDWLAHRGLYTHFYPQKTLENHAVAHGDLGKYPYGVVIESTLKVWRGYEVIRAFADARGQRIVNCTAGGFLDVFERESYEDVIGSTSTSTSALAAAQAA